MSEAKTLVTLMLGGVFNGTSGPELGDIDYQVNFEEALALQEELVTNDDVYVDLVARSDFDAQRLRADTAEADALIQYAKRVAAVEELAAAEQRIAEQNSLLEEMATEMTLAISDSQIRSAMTVIGRTRFLQILQAHNARIDAALNQKSEGESHANNL